MRLYGRGLPSAFIRLDDRTTTADQCVNVWTKQTFRNNHNILLARRCRWPIMTVHMDQDSAGSAANGPDGLYWRSIITPDRESGIPILQVPIEIPPFCTSIVINLDALKVGGTEHAYVYPIVDGPGTYFQINSSVAATVSATTPWTVSSVSVPVPQSARDYGHGTLTLYASTPLYGPDLKGAGGVAIADVGPDWVEGTAANFASFTVETAVYFTNNLAIAPRKVVRAATIGGNTRIHVDFPWNVVPTVGTDLIDARAVTILRIRSISVYADVVSDFSAEVVPL